MKLAHLQEVRYHRSLSMHNANIAYQDAYDAAVVKEGERNIKMARPGIGGPSDRRYVYADIVVYVEDKQEAIQAIKRFVEKFKIPYNQFHGLARHRDIVRQPRNIPYWRVTIAYENNE